MTGGQFYVMEEKHIEALKYRLLDEIAKIEARVHALGTPRDMAQRSLMARYGKLLLLSQRLLSTLSKIKTRPISAEFRAGATEIQPVVKTEPPGPDYRWPF